MTNDGYRLLDQGGAPVFVPPTARSIAVAQDGTVSADGAPIARIGLWQPSDPLTLQHQAGTMFSADDVEPTDQGTVLQGYLEDSSVDSVREVTELIKAQRGYELNAKVITAADQMLSATTQLR